jgi:hypothetical protein
MFGRLFAKDPQKLMREYLRGACPDPDYWQEICAYLIKGRRAKTKPAKSAIKTYLDLREALGGLAAFRAAGELTYDSLSKPCDDFACSYDTAASSNADQTLAWARFLLAADYLLALAYEASLTPGLSRGEQAGRMEKLFTKIQKEYLKPLERDRMVTGKTAEAPALPPMASEAAAA